jgi:hypothetical protein
MFNVDRGQKPYEYKTKNIPEYYEPIVKIRKQPVFVSRSVLIKQSVFNESQRDRKKSHAKHVHFNLKPIEINTKNQV